MCQRGVEMAYSALTIAKYFLALQDKDSGELISNLKLQKLLYYAQGYHVAFHGVNNPLFQEKIYAWKHGPVVRAVYTHFAGYNRRAIPAGDIPKLDDKTGRFVDEIHRPFGRYSAWALREMTHREPPWRDNYVPDELDIEIPLSDLRSFFSKHVSKGKK